MSVAQRSEAFRTGAPAQRQILIVDDSVVARAVIGRMIAASRDFAVAGAVADAAAALAFLKTNSVDIILLDLEMPGLNGLTALPELIVAGRGAKVLIVSSACAEGAATTVQALALGAADTLVKPGVGAFGGRFAEILEERLARLSVAVAETEGGASLTALPNAISSPEFDIVAIGASTGGIHALSQMLRALPADLGVPVLITQHLPDSFMPYFAAQIAVVAARPCVVATDRMRLVPDRIIVAPGDAHLVCVSLGAGQAVRLSRERSPSGCLPSVDPMFASVAEVFGRRALAVVLSGMGRDGTHGARRIAEAGGAVVVQDRATSVVWGMPGSVAAAGNAHAVLPPAAIGRLVASRKRPS